MPDVTERIKLALSFMPDEVKVDAYLRELLTAMYLHGYSDGYRECGEKVLAQMQEVADG